MTQLERMEQGLPYITDAAVLERQKRARRLTQALNTADRSDFQGLAAIVKELLGKSENAFINPPFYCDYGFHIELGKNVFINYNCTILDTAKVTIGDCCQIAPTYPSTRRGILWRRTSGTPSTNTAWKSPSETACGSAAIR